MPITQAQGGFQDQSAIFNQGMAILGQGVMAFGNKMEQRRRDENQEITKQVQSIVDQYDMGGLYLTNPQLAEDYSKRLGVDISIYKNTADTLSKQGLTPGSLEFQNAFSALTPWNKDKAAAFSRDVMQLGIGGGQGQAPSPSSQGQVRAQPQGTGQPALGGTPALIQEAIPQGARPESTQLGLTPEEITQEVPVEQPGEFRVLGLDQPAALEAIRPPAVVDPTKQSQVRPEGFREEVPVETTQVPSVKVGDIIDKANIPQVTDGISARTPNVIEITKNPNERVSITAPIGVTEDSLGPFNLFTPEEWNGILQVPEGERVSATTSALQGKGFGLGAEKGDMTYKGTKLDALQVRAIRQQIIANADAGRPSDAMTDGWWWSNIDKDIGMKGLGGEVESQGEVKISPEVTSAEFSQKIQEADTAARQDTLDNPDKISPSAREPIDSQNAFQFMMNMAKNKPEDARFIYPETMKAIIALEESQGNAALSQARAEEARQNLWMKNRIIATIGEEELIKQEAANRVAEMGLQGQRLELARLGIEEAKLKNLALEKRLDAMGEDPTLQGKMKLLTTMGAIKDKDSGQEELFYMLLNDLYLNPQGRNMIQDDPNWLQSIIPGGVSSAWYLEPVVPSKPEVPPTTPTATPPGAGDKVLEEFYRNNPELRP